MYGVVCVGWKTRGSMCKASSNETEKVEQIKNNFVGCPSTRHLSY